MPNLKLYAFPHDTIMLGENIKYSSILMSLTNPVFDISSKYSEYYKFMRPYFHPDGPALRVFSTLRHFLERGMEAGNETSTPSYLAFAGVHSPVIQEFSPSKTLYVRTVYRYKEEFLPCLPQSVLYEVYKGSLYFIYPESETAVLTFHGQTSQRSVFNLTLQFLGVHRMEDREWDISTLLDILFSKHDEIGYSDVQLFAAAVEKGYRGSQIELVESARQDSKLEEVKGFFKKKSKVSQLMKSSIDLVSYYPWVTKNCPLWTVEERKEYYDFYSGDRVLIFQKYKAMKKAVKH